MVTRTALIRTATNLVENISLIDDAAPPWTPPSGFFTQPALATTNVGDTWNGSGFTPGPIVPTTPTLVAGPALGSSPPTPSVIGDDNLGIIRVGTGAAPVIGEALTITFAKPRAAAPIVLLTALSAGVVTKFPYVSASSPTGFTISVAVAINANVPAGNYLTYQVYGG